MKFKFFLVSLTMVLIGASGTVGEPDQPEVSTTLRSIGIGVDLRNVQAGSDSDNELMSVASHDVSEPVRYRGPQAVTFYTLQPELEEFDEYAEDELILREQEEPKPPGTTNPPEKTEPPRAITSANLNPEWSHTVLVWLRNARGQIRVMAVNGDLLDFPLGHVRFVNLTPFRLGMITKDNGQEIIQPIGHWTVDVGDSRTVHFHAVLNLPDTDYDVISNVVEMRPHVRRVVFFNYSAFDQSRVGVGRTPFFSFWIHTERE